MTERLPRVAINGFGRIGRCLARLIASDPDPQFEWVAVNDLIPREQMAYLLKHDSTHGRFGPPVELVNDNQLQVGDVRVTCFSERDPAKLPWAELDIDLVVECTGFFRKRSQAALHLEAGAGRVIISAPGDDKDAPDITAICDINSDQITAEHKVISAASCTTTCLAPLVRAIDEMWGVEAAQMTTIHAYTKDQEFLDSPHKDARRGRAGAVNIVPTSTGAAKAIGLVVPSLAGKVDGYAVRVPVLNCSLIDLTVQTRKPVTAAAFNEGIRAAAAALPPGVMRIEDIPIVSSDMIGDSTGCVVDVALTKVQGDRLLKAVAWYDNEWGYASRLYALVGRVAG